MSNYPDGVQFPAEKLFYEADLAEDDLKSIISLKTDLGDMFSRMHRLIKDGTLSQSQDKLIELMGIVEEEIDDFLCKDYDKYKQQSGSISYPYSIPAAIPVRSIELTKGELFLEKLNNDLAEVLL